MKKTFVIALLIGLTFVSCKKDYICACTTSVVGYSQTDNITIHDTKNKAETTCTAMSSSTVILGVTGSKTCVIK